MHGTAQCIANLGARSLLELASWGAFVHLPCGLTGRLHNLHHLHLWRCPITRSPEFTPGDFIFNTVIAGSGMLEIGASQLNNWRLHEPPDFLPFCQPGALSTRLYCSWMPRHHFRLPGRYKTVMNIFEKQFHVLKLCFRML